MITLEEFKKKQIDKCRLIGLDLGSKRIGVSICDEKQLILAIVEVYSYRVGFNGN